MVIKHKINTSLENAYYNILWRLDSVGANYETENHIVPKWDPTARDEYGNQYPKPDPDTVDTGTAWIKVLFKDRKQVLVYFCCHLVECKTCTYDKFITVYNYTDDIGDTNLQSILPWLALKYYDDRSSDDSDRTVYFKAKSYNGNALEFYAPEYTVIGTEPCDYVDNAGNPCKNGTITTKVTPKGNDNTYIPAPTIELKTVCPKCNGSGKLNTVTELVKGGWLMLYEFYINVDNGYYKELQKVTDFNIELYRDPETHRPLNSLEAVYELIEKTKAENEGKPINEQTDLSNHIFAIPIFTQNIEMNYDTNKLTTKWIISGFRFYQTNYVDKDGKLIPLKAYAFWIPYTAPRKNIPDDYNRLGVSDCQLSSQDESGSIQIQVEPEYYDCGLMYRLGGIKNFLKHCGEVETNAATIHTPLVETYTDISNTDKIWNFICRKDKNLPIFPFDNNTLYISETSKPFEVDLYKNNNHTFKNILAQKTASNYSPLDAAVIKPEDPVPEVEPTGNENKIPVYPIDYFYGIEHITNLDMSKYLQLSNASNNSTYEFKNGYGHTVLGAGDIFLQSYFNSIPGLIINNYTKILNLCFNFHITIPEDKINKQVYPHDSHLTVFTLRITYGDIDDNGNTFTSGHHLLTKQIQMDASDVYKSIYIDDDGNICYVWPTSINIIDYVLISGVSDIDIPFKNKRIYFSISYLGSPESNPYDISAMDITVEVTALSNIQRVSFKTASLVNTNINLLPKIEYNYNNYPEGIFNYYQNKFDTSIENYIFYKYHNELMDREPTDNGLTLIPDTIESQKKYKGFLNLMYQRKLRSIYTKQDSRDDYFTCPICQGDTNIKCDFCNGKRKLSMYDYNKNPNYNPNDASKGPEILVRYTCPDINNIDHEQGISCANRCRICAGTKSMVRYYYYNALEFKNLTEYNGKNPVDIESLSNLDALNIKNRILTNKVKEKGSTLKEPYLNYLIRKYYNVPVQGTELDFDKYYEYYNMAINNTVFYILNGNFTSYYYYVRNDHIKVNYGYNYIYATKTVDRKTWDRDKSTFTDNTVLYRVISDPTDVDNMIGFYVITETDVKTEDTNFANARLQRIYFDKSWVYSNLLNDMTFNKFNTFIENKHNVVGKHQDLERIDITGEKLPSYAHIHNDDEQLVDTRCTTCNGTGIDPEDETKPCPLCGGSGDYPDNLQPETLYFEKAVYSYSSSEYINTNNISFEVDDQVSVDDLVEH